MQSSIGNIIPATQAGHYGRYGFICAGGNMNTEGGKHAVHLNTTDLICMLFIVRGITWIAYEPVHLADVAMDTGPPQCVSFSLSCTHKRASQTWSFLRYLGTFFEVQYGAAAARQELSNTPRLCWPRPLANLGWRQHRVLGDLNQSVKVSAPPSPRYLCLLQGFFTRSLPPAAPSS